MAAREGNAWACVPWALALVLVLVPGTEGLASNKTALALAQKVNERGPWLGLVVPNIYELAPLLAPGVFVPDATIPSVDLAGRRFYVGTIENKKIIAVMCGLSMTNAAITTQQLLDFFDISGVLHYGIAGGVNDALHIGDVSIAKYWAHSGLWVWQRYGQGANDSLPLEEAGDFTREFGYINIGDYNVPKGTKQNLLNKIWYQPEEVFPVSGTPQVRQHYFFIPVDKHFYGVAKKITNVELVACLPGNTTACLNPAPKLVVGDRAVSANIFLDNAAYRDFLYKKFKVQSVDMESAAVSLTCLANGVPFIAFRSLSDLAGGSADANTVNIFASLAATNAVLVLTSFLKEL